MTGQSPPGRALHAMAYDQARGELIVFGGGKQYGGSATYGDPWTLGR